MPEKEELILVHRYLSGQMDGREKEEFEQNLVQNPALAALHAEVSALWTASAQYRMPEFDANMGYRTFQRNIRSKRTIRGTWLVSAAAAVVLLLVAVGLYFQDEVTVMTDVVASATMDKNLEDGSSLQLRTGAHLLIPEAFKATSRRVEIVSGDVFFDIAPDEKRPFVITHPWADVKVVGTEFIISVDTVAHAYTIMVIEGKVSFTPQLSKKNIMLSAGNGLRFHADTRVIESLQNVEHNDISWHTGVLSFVDTPVKDVVTDLSRHFAVEIAIENPAVADCLFTAPLPYRDVSLDVILEALSTTFGMSIQHIGNNCLLRGGKCR